MEDHLLQLWEIEPYPPRLASWLAQMTRCFGVLIVQDLVLGHLELIPFPLHW